MLRPTRRALLAAPLAAPALAAAQGQRVLRFVPQADLAILDPIVTTATVTMLHGYAVFDTLYGTDAGYGVQPQMVEGHRIEEEGRRWTLTLREGLLFHDGEPVRGRDCVASIRRWAARDVFGTELLAATDELSAPDDRTILFRLKHPFPLLPRALGKVTTSMPAIMPERLALADPARGLTEMIGSGPWRFLAEERLAGARLAYARFEGYRPREGQPSRTAGPKQVHFDRMEWHILPDPATAGAALQRGEVDWLEYAGADLVPLLRRNRELTVTAVDDRNASVLRFNHLQPPFDNPAIRRAVLPVISQTDCMLAAYGEDRATWRDDIGTFLTGTPMASEVGLAPLRGPRDPTAARRALDAAGYRGEPVAVLQPNDFAQLKALAEVVADGLRQAGMAVQLVAADWGSIVQRRASKAPVAQGGWSVFVSGVAGAGVLDPVSHLALRSNGAGAWFGWPDSPRIEQLRRDWMAATELAAQQAIAREIQLQAMQDLPYVPLGEYSRVTAHRRTILDIPTGHCVFWGVRRA
ncbi:ABC transporter substrate-binding protein [Belnapia sp. T6]|uniref:ABC transporter substrate-binding protein n=1 Tax=Belnapia mucosa TaxID=2804532 RepID=A0ABS1V6I8_9PROT|nr:ABC transporter substrate-binding protein [Belnapia mucosa]MBL6456349.1 ABC transporter substrate-binding protein [Belnapia mucosa]